MSTMDQVVDNVKTFGDFTPLNDDESDIVEQVRKDILDSSKVDCTSCNYCMPCPHGVDIPRNFRTYNAHAMYQNDGHTKWVYESMQKEMKSADMCIECGECLPKCPQQIEIPTELANFDAYLKENGITK
jgi:hypothetical protein